ncbi:MAG: hypothetical protein WBA66_05180 [Xanthobacteraceae bacterium]
MSNGSRNTHARNVNFHCDRGDTLKVRSASASMKVKIAKSARFS